MTETHMRAEVEEIPAAAARFLDGSRDARRGGGGGDARAPTRGWS